MKNKKKLQIEMIMLDKEETTLFADGFDEAILGLDAVGYRVIYSILKCYKILMIRDKMTKDEAIEYFTFNVLDAYVGEKTPIWCEDNF
jgi:hypothetical protein